MKPENNLENKAKFFALYWGVKCLRNELLNDQIPPHKVDCGNCKGLPQQYLQLKPLFKITDEDAVEILKMLNIVSENHCYWKNAIKEIGICHTLDVLLSDTNLCFQVLDYLRSRGYLVGWMGLTPDEIIERKWAQYKED